MLDDIFYMKEHENSPAGLFAVFPTANKISIRKNKARMILVKKSKEGGLHANEFGKGKACLSKPINRNLLYQ